MPAFQSAGEPIPAIGYIRVSLAREEMISPELQRESITKWAQRTGHRIVDWVEDLDKTGRDFKRRIMGVIERVESGEARVIAVWKYSRFGRTRTGVPANLARVEKVGGQLLSATEEVDARTAIGRFQRGMIMEFNAFESDRAGEQWMETHQWRRDHGLPAMGRPRFGYIWHQRKIFAPDGSITLREERYEAEPGKADIVESLYLRYIAGESFRALALWLNDAGYRTVRETLWTGKAVRRYLDSGFPAGYLRLHRKTCPQGSFPHDCDHYDLIKHPTLHHPEIIKDATWREYQARRDFTRTAAPRSRNASYPFTGLTRCGICNGSAKRKVDGRKAAVYVCLARSDKGPHACTGTSVREAAIRDEVKEYLARLVKEIDQEAGQHERARFPLQCQNPAVQRLQTLEEASAKLERSIARHMKAYALADDDDDTGELQRAYLATLKELRTDKASMSAEIARLRAHEEAGGEDAQKTAAVGVAIGLLEEWATCTPARLNTLLRRVVARVELLGNREARVVPIWEA
jgi:site-specific DNA recombinase